MNLTPEQKPPWRGKAKDFADFQDAIMDELNKKSDGSEWVVTIEVKKVGNPVHDYRIVLKPLN